MTMRLSYVTLTHTHTRAHSHAHAHAHAHPPTHPPTHTDYIVTQTHTHTHTHKYASVELQFTRPDWTVCTYVSLSSALQRAQHLEWRTVASCRPAIRLAQAAALRSLSLMGIP